jgi:hypothetical protein
MGARKQFGGGFLLKFLVKKSGFLVVVDSPNGRAFYPCGTK